MTSSGGAFSQTLQEITNTKLEELAKKRASFEKSKAATLANVESKTDPVDMLIALLDGTKSCFEVRQINGKIVRGSSGSPKLETDLRNLRRFIDQARFDPSISPKIIDQWKETLLNHLDAQSLKYQYADLYGKLTVEWLSSSSKSKSDQGDAMDIDDFEKVAVKAKLEARESWERNVFVEAKVDPSAIDGFLNQTFGGDDARKALKGLKDKVAEIEDILLAPKQFNSYTLKWTIKGLLASDLLTNEKRSALRDFLSNETVLNELADVLNMRMAALESWSWGSEVAVEARRELNGGYKIYMHEDLLQAIFLQYIGVKWSVGLKEGLMKFMWAEDVWKRGHKEVSPTDRQRLQWYISTDMRGDNVEQERGNHFLAGYFVSQLLNSVDQDLSLEEGDVEADFGDFANVAKKKKMAGAFVSQAPQAPQQQQMQQMQMQTMQTASRNRMRQTPAAVTRDGVYADEDSDEDMGFGLFEDDPNPQDRSMPNLTAYRPTNPMDARQRLLHLLSTEILVKTRVDGELTSFRSQFNGLYSSLPHITINAILAYLGVSDKWLNFFRTFLQAPLKFLDEDTKPRLRKKGTPGAHVLSDVFAESVLFCLDIAINRQTDGEVLWRMSNDFWFWSSSHESCVKAWDIIGQFNKTMGLALDDTRSAAVRFQRKDGKVVPAKLAKSLPEGEIRWGMLYLDPETGRFTVDRSMVDKHIEELRRQLKDKEKSIFAWVQAYSTYASVFFTTNFGKPANCFGREHLDMMLGMHERIQKTLFSTSADGSVTSVVDWLKKQIEQRFGVKDVPDGYLFFPTELGGLDVKSPFIGSLQLRDSVTKDPQALLDEFEESERKKYTELKKRYLAKKPWEYPSKPNQYRPNNPEEFMPFKEYIKFREQLHYGLDRELVNVFKELLNKPNQEPLEVEHNYDILFALQRCTQTGTITNWHNMDAYWKWVTMLYGPEMLQKFGGFEIVDPGLLPMGMVSMFRSGRVSWQE